MTSANTNLIVTELDPLTIKENLKNFLKGQAEFSDYNFEGSSLNILMDLLAYNTHYMAFYMNMLSSESFLDSAQQRATILSHAKHIGYIPNSKNPATALVNIKVTPSVSEDQNNQTLNLPRWTKFQSEAVDGTNYSFVTINANNAVKTANTFNFSNVVLKQGDVVTRTYLVDAGNEKREFSIPSANVDINNIYVTVQESPSNTSYEVFNRHQDLTELRSNSSVYFIEEQITGNGSYKLYFGDGFLGKKPKNGNVVTITYLDTEGEIGNGANSFVLVNSIGGYDDNVEITVTSPAGGGSAGDTLEDIRFRAPLFYTTQNRSVTVEDYKTLLLKDYPNIESISVWGGESEQPPVYGKVYISLKPKTNFYITDTEKRRIVEEIIRNRSVMTVIPEIIEPDFTYVIFRVKAFYNKTKANLDEDQLSALVRAKIIQYRNERLRQFDSRLRISNLQQSIVSAHPAITSCTITVMVQKRIEPEFFTNKNYAIDFKFPLNKAINENKLFSFPNVSVRDGDGIARNCLIEEIPQSFTGIDAIRITNAGNDYEDVNVVISGDGSGATATATIVNKKLQQIVLNNRGSNYSTATVSILSDTGKGAAASVELQFNKGQLRLFYYKENGEKVIINDNLGTIDYRTGKINIDNLEIENVISNSNYNDTIWTIAASPEDQDISPVRNSILELDTADSSSIRITMIAE